MSEFLITANPKTPKSGRKKLFPKSDGAWYDKDSSGVVRPIGLRPVPSAPANANSSGQLGDIYSANDGTYLCVAANSWIKIATSSFAGESDLVTYVSDYQYWIEGTTMKVAFSLIYGGVISYFGLKTGGKNYVHTLDLGKYNGVSFYSDPEPYTVSGHTAHAGFTNASWNPVQAGDAGGNGSPVLTYSFNGSTDQFTISCNPMQWKFIDGLVETAVTITAQYTFIDASNAVKCHYTVSVDRGAMSVPGRAMETPFFYFTRDLENITAYTGGSPWTGGATSSPSYSYTAFGVPNTAAIFEPTEKWVYIHDGAGNGIGIFNNDFAENWTVTKTLTTGEGVTTTSPPTMIVQMTDTYTDTGIFTFEKECYIILDSAANVRAFAVANH